MKFGADSWHAPAAVAPAETRYGLARFRGYERSRGGGAAQGLYIQLVSKPAGLIRIMDRVGGSSLLSWYRWKRKLLTSPAKKPQPLEMINFR